LEYEYAESEEEKEVAGDFIAGKRPWLVLALRQRGCRLGVS
jgi:hypothetical protein